MTKNKKILAKGQGSDTRDIIFYLCQVVPAAIKQINFKDWPKTGDLLTDAKNIGTWINKNIKYKRDGYSEQNIQLPKRLLNDRIGDCKSFSLLFLCIMDQLGYKGGFRFASYHPNKIPTHVYNFFLDSKGNIHTFDACIKNLKESPRATYIKDMEINYLAGTPVMIEKYHELGKKKKDKGGVIKRVALAGPRAAFLGLLMLNFRGFGTKITNNPKIKNKFSAFWQKLGGDPRKLFEAALKGSKKKPLFGSKKTTKKGVTGINATYLDDNEQSYIGEPVTLATVSTALVAAAPIIGALTKLFQKENIAVEETELPPHLPLDEGSGFEAADKEIKDVASATGGGFFDGKTGPLILGGVGLAAILLLTMKRKK